MIASLPMYTAPHTAVAEGHFWAGMRDRLRDAGVAAPDRLTDSIPDLLAHWLSPDLILSQTCSLPYRTRLREHVTLVGTPDYRVPGCPPGYYRSLVIARHNDTRENLNAFKRARFAYNDPLSQSGWAAVALEIPWVLHCPHLCTGSHRASAMAVADDRADFASVDAVTFRNLTVMGETAGLRVIYETQPTPALPFITARNADPDVLLACMTDALAALAPPYREALGLRSVLSLPSGAYDLPIPPAPHANAV